MRPMMKGLVAGAAMFLAAGQAAAADYAAPADVYEPGHYVSLFAGWAFMADDPNGSYEGSYNYTFDLDSGFLVGGAIGTHITPNFRGEMELSFTSHDIDDVDDSDGDSLTGSGEVDMLFILANFWYDFDLGVVSPYLGGGVGVANIDADLDLYDNSGYTWEVDDWVLAGQLGAGFMWDINDMFTLDFGYRLKATSSVNFAADDASYDITDVSFVQHVVQLGITFGF
jgi:opacity protein-like surface antigen